MAVVKEQIRQIISENNISSVADVYTLLKDSFKDILQELMEAELDAALGYEKNHKGDLQTDNKRNGHSTKNLKSQYGEFQIDVPRDRNGEFEPKLIPKYQRDISGIEEKVISLYARGLSTRDIHDQLQDLYGIEMSAEMVEFAEQDENGEPVWNVYHFINLDFNCQGLREYLWSNMVYYVGEIGADGFRCDVGDAIPNDFWAEGRRRIQAIKPDAVLINEGCEMARLASTFDACYGISWEFDIYEVFEGKKACPKFGRNMRTLRRRCRPAVLWCALWILTIR